MTNSHHLKQPPIFYLASIASLWERFGFYIINWIFILYAKSLFHLTDSVAFALFGVFTALTTLTPIIGGYIADNILGIKRSWIMGLSLATIGYAILIDPHKYAFFPGIAVAICGMALFKTAPTNLMGRQYKRHDPRIDSGFTLLYIAMNIGTFASSMAAGILHQYFGWHIAFIAASLALLLGLIISLIFNHTCDHLDTAIGQQKFKFTNWLKIIVGIIVACIIITFLASKIKITYIAIACVSILIFAYFIYEIIKSPTDERKGIIVCLILMFIGMVFFILYFQANMSITLFIKRIVAHHVLGIRIPTVCFLSSNPLWIIILGPILAAIYKTAGKKNKDFTIMTKFSLGLLSISLCFLILKLSTLFVDSTGKITGIWIIAAFFFYSLGELLISALGVAMVTKIAPKRMYGVMMGAWYLIALALAASCSSYLATFASIPPNLHDLSKILHIYGHAFVIISSLGLGVTFLTFIIGPTIKRAVKL